MHRLERSKFRAAVDKDDVAHCQEEGTYSGKGTIAIVGGGLIKIFLLVGRAREGEDLEDQLNN